MPTKMTIPERRHTMCSPCEHLASDGGMRGGPGNVWDWWKCNHPEAHGPLELSDDKAVAAKQIELRERLKTHGRNIGKSLAATQPCWCPLRPENAK